MHTYIYNILYTYIYIYVIIHLSWIHIKSTPILDLEVAWERHAPAVLAPRGLQLGPSHPSCQTHRCKPQGEKWCNCWILNGWISWISIVSVNPNFWIVQSQSLMFKSQPLTAASVQPRFHDNYRQLGMAQWPLHTCSFKVPVPAGAAVEKQPRYFPMSDVPACIHANKGVHMHMCLYRFMLLLCGYLCLDNTYVQINCTYS